MNAFKTTVLMVTLTLMLIATGGFLGGKSGMTFALIMAFSIILSIVQYCQRACLQGRASHA